MNYDDKIIYDYALLVDLDEAGYISDQNKPLFDKIYDNISDKLISKYGSYVLYYTLVNKLDNRLDEANILPPDYITNFLDLIKSQHPQLENKVKQFIKFNLIRRKSEILARHNLDDNKIETNNFFGKDAKIVNSVLAQSYIKTWSKRNLTASILSHLLDKSNLHEFWNELGEYLHSGNTDHLLTLAMHKCSKPVIDFVEMIFEQK